LNRRANQLATYLKSFGVGPDILVALCVERSADLVIGLLGILKAGGAYLPLDPSFPAERLSYMIEDSNAPVILTERAIADRFIGLGAKAVLLDDDSTTISGQPDSNLSVDVNPSNLAYVIYTSGSTGRPKGVQITHQALVNFLVSMQKEPGLTERDVFHAVTTVSFDIAALEIFLPLVTGARVVITRREISADPELLMESITTSNASVMQATPVTWRMLLDHGWSGTPRLKVLCGGEAMGTDLARRLLDTGCELWNLYGPTETTIWSSLSRVRTAEDAASLGRPIANTELLILSPRLTPQPLGIPGELHIGGDGLARGYLNRTELTHERFISHPLRPGRRLFKTGDLAKRRPDGTIEFLGRMDNQVKLRGFRIELGEIESCLEGVEGVKQAVVVAREDEPGEKRLVAYYTTTHNSQLDGMVLAAFLRDRLPEYMIPSAHVFLHAFPLTPNRKVDRTRLPKPDSPAACLGRSYEPPEGETETKLAAIFASVLKVPRVGRNDNFFDLGGQSILAATLFHRIAIQFGRRLSLTTLFKAATVGDLAAYMARASSAGSWPSLVPIRLTEGKPRFFCVHGAGGNLLLYRDLAKHLASTVSFFGLQSQGLDGRTEPLRTVEMMARRYVQEIRAVQPHGPYLIGGYCMGGTIAYEMAHVLREQGQEVALLVLLDTYNFQRGRHSSTVSTLWQKAWFHWGNLRRIPLRHWRTYLTIKFRIARDGELPILVNNLISRLRRRGDFVPTPSDKRVQIINQAAAMTYRPRVYPGRLTLVKPRINYSSYGAPDMGWGDLVAGQLDTILLPMNPHAMLVEPFVQHLAAALAAKIEQPDHGSLRHPARASSVASEKVTSGLRSARARVTRQMSVA
jgi:amino acid adenylation domain-containing protein